MRSSSRLTACVVLTALTAGCAGARPRAQADPRGELNEARRLYMDVSRPAAAEKKIHEAMTALAAAHDEAGLAEAYHRYADFLSSPAVANNEPYFRRHGFLDPAVTFDNRLQKSVAYLDRATAIFMRLKRYDALTNTSTARGIALAHLHKRDDACASFEQSVTFRDETRRRNPKAHPYVPEGYGSWDAYISRLEKWAGCGG